MLALVAVCEIAGFSWLQSSIIRLYPDETDDAGRAQLAAAVRLGFGLSALVISVACIVALVSLPAFAEQWALGVAGITVLLIRSWASMGQNWSRVTQRPWHFATALMLQSIGIVVFTVIGLAWWTDDPVVGLRHQEDVLIADSPEVMADQIIGLYSDAGLWRRLSSGGYRAFEERFSLASGGPKVVAIVDGLVAARRR